MLIELKIPSPGESINEVEIANWLVNDGDVVEKDQEIAEVESDKATLPLIAPDSGKVKIMAKEGETIKVGDVACTIDTSVAPRAENRSSFPTGKKIPEKQEDTLSTKTETIITDNKGKTGKKQESDLNNISAREKNTSVKVTPLAKKMMEENNLSVDDILNGLKKITTNEVSKVLSLKQNKLSSPDSQLSRETKRVKMSQLRRKLSQRLVKVKNETAMLTTFNEVDMSRIIELRKKYQKQFQEKHGIKLGFMSFFTMAVTGALKLFSKVNSMIDGDEIITPEYVDICIAVQTDKGLMVPVLRNTETMSLAQLEHKIAELAQKARNFTISIEEMTGGTFTITNGGVFGSMLSTPILNPPQSAILGMHNIVERPVVVNGNIEIRPIMYLALSYDHRIVDGSDSVSFLVKIKEFIENPSKMVFEGNEPDKMLLGL